MIAVNESPRNDMVCLFKTLRGYVGGNTEAVDFCSTGRRGNLDDNLATIGFRRVEDWQPVPNQPRAIFARVEPMGYTDPEGCGDEECGVCWIAEGEEPVHA